MIRIVKDKENISKTIIEMLITCNCIGKFYSLKPVWVSLTNMEVDSENESITLDL